MKIDFLGQSASPRSLSVQNLRCLNAYAEVTESRQGTSVSALYGTPGLRFFTTLPGAGSVRALYTTPHERMFAVQAGGLYEVRGDATFALRGSLNTTTGAVSLADNGLQLFLADGAHAYAFHLSTNVFAALPLVGAADCVAVIDGYAIFNQAGTGRFLISDLYSSAVDPADVGTMEGRADILVSLLAKHGELWLFGTHSTEVWFNAGGVDFPFQRIQGAFFEAGIAARLSMAKMGEAIFWLGRDDQGQGIVWQAEGFTPRRISTHPVETAIRSYGNIRDAVAFTEQRDGHYWYWLNFPGANTTWVFDATTSLWHERGWLNPTTGDLERHRAFCHTFAFNKHLVGDRENGTLYESDFDTYSDNGVALPCEFTLPPIYDAQGHHTVQHRHLCLHMETGVGVDGGVVPGTDPQIMMQMSNDSGKKWGNEHWRSLGKLGQRRATVNWWQLGGTEDRRYKFRISDAVKRAFIAAYIDAVPLAA